MPDESSDNQAGSARENASPTVASESAIDKVPLIDGHDVPPNLFVDGVYGIMTSNHGFVKFNLYEDRINYNSRAESGKVTPSRVVVAHINMPYNLFIGMVNLFVDEIKIAVDIAKVKNNE